MPLARALLGLDLRDALLPAELPECPRYRGSYRCKVERLNALRLGAEAFLSLHFMLLMFMFMFLLARRLRINASKIVPSFPQLRFAAVSR